MRKCEVPNSVRMFRAPFPRPATPAASCGAPRFRCAARKGRSWKETRPARLLFRKLRARTPRCRHSCCPHVARHPGYRRTKSRSGPAVSVPFTHQRREGRVARGCERKNRVGARCPFAFRCPDAWVGSIKARMVLEQSTCIRSTTEYMKTRFRGSKSDVRARRKFDRIPPPPSCSHHTHTHDQLRFIVGGELRRKRKEATLQSSHHNTHDFCLGPTSAECHRNIILPTAVQQSAGVVLQAMLCARDFVSGVA